MQKAIHFPFRSSTGEIHFMYRHPSGNTRQFLMATKPPENFLCTFYQPVALRTPVSLWRANVQNIRPVGDRYKAIGIKDGYICTIKFEKSHVAYQNGAIEDWQSQDKKKRNIKDAKAIRDAEKIEIVEEISEL